MGYDNYSNFVRNVPDLANTDLVTSYLKKQSQRHRLELYQYLFSAKDKNDSASLSERRVVAVPKPQERLRLMKIISETLESEKEPIASLVAEVGDTPLMKHLIQQGSAIHNPDPHGIPPIITALRNQHMETVIALLDQGAAKTLSKEHQAELLMGLTSEQPDCVLQLIQQGYEADVPDAQGVTPLMIALFNQNWDLAELLIGSGADVKRQDSVSLTPLHYCLIQGDSALPGVQLCLKQGADFEAFIRSLPEENTTGMLEAYKRNPEEFFKTVNFSQLQQALFSFNVDERMDKVRREILETKLDASVSSKIDDLVARLSHTPFRDWERWEKELPKEIKVLNELRTKGSQTIDRKTIKDWAKANESIMKWAEGKSPLTKDRIAGINDIIDPESGGEYHDVDVVVDGEEMRVYFFSKDVEEELGRFISWLNAELQAADEKKMNPIELAARAYMYLITIHPFSNGNGRTVRLVMDYVLKRSQLPPSALGDNVDVAAFMFLPKNISVSTVVMMVYEGILNASHLLKLKT